MEFCILRHPSSVLIQKYRSELCKSVGSLPPTMKLGGQLSPLPPFSYPLHISCTLPLTTVSHFTSVVRQQNPHAILFKILPYNTIIVHTATEIHPPSLSLVAGKEGADYPSCSTLSIGTCFLGEVIFHSTMPVLSICACTDTASPPSSSNSLLR